MRCPHCCFNCTEKGDDIDYKKVLKIAEHNVRIATVGGGEPTLHPQFRKIVEGFIELRLVIGVVTNGSNAKETRWLIKKAEENKLIVALSWDQYHDASLVDPKIKRFFLENYGTGSQSKIQLKPEPWMSHHHWLMKFGRGKKLKEAASVGSKCLCEEFFVKPDAKIYYCGCPGSDVVGDENGFFDDSAVRSSFFGTCYKMRYDDKKTG